jgi:nitrogenase molybdenum-iron protein alpha chain
MSLLDTKNALTREKRTGALSHYHGSLTSIPEDISGKDIPQRVRTFSQSTPGEIIFALRALSGIRDSAIIIHGAAGCSASGLFFNPRGTNSWYSTGLNESDTILGGENKLRSAIQRAYTEKRPELVFIIGTPINAINNDDVNSIIRELEDEYPAKILYVDVNGFRTKNALSGYDAVFHSLLKKAVEYSGNPDTLDKPFINLLSVSETPGNLLSITRLLKRLDIPVNILPRYSSFEGLRKASSALLSVSLNDDENDYFLTGLEESFAAAHIRTNTPIGAVAVSDFLRKIAARFDKTALTEEFIKNEEQTAVKWVSKKPFSGSRVFVETDLCQAAGLSSLIEELGGKIAGFLIPQLDSRAANKLKDLGASCGNVPLIIAAGQQFEVFNVLGKHPADYFIGSSANAQAAAGAGARPIITDNLVYYGYAGIEELAKKVLVAGKNSFAEHYPQTSPYSTAWKNRSGNWYVKLEVS